MEKNRKEETQKEESKVRPVAEAGTTEDMKSKKEKQEEEAEQKSQTEAPPQKVPPAPKKVPRSYLYISSLHFSLTLACAFMVTVGMWTHHWIAVYNRSPVTVDDRRGGSETQIHEFSQTTNFYSYCVSSRMSSLVEGIKSDTARCNYTDSLLGLSGLCDLQPHHASNILVARYSLMAAYTSLVLVAVCTWMLYIRWFYNMTVHCFLGMAPFFTLCMDLWFVRDIKENVAETDDMWSPIFGKGFICFILLYFQTLMVSPGFFHKFSLLPEKFRPKFLPGKLLALCCFAILCVSLAVFSFYGQMMYPTCPKYCKEGKEELEASNFMTGSYFCLVFGYSARIFVAGVLGTLFCIGLIYSNNNLIEL